MIEALQYRVLSWKHREDTQAQSQARLKKEISKIKKKYEDQPATRPIIELFEMLDALV